jgi:molecular chaperone DnaK (HSP70)
VITIDVESILSVTAREIKSGREASVTIRPSGGLTQREMVEIITRRRNETSIAAMLPADAASLGSVRVTTREQMVTTPGSSSDDDDPQNKP